MPSDGQKPLKLTGAKAGSGLTGASVQYKFVKLSADKTVVLCTSANDKPVGVLQAPAVATGDAVEVVVAGETMVQAEAALAFGYGIGPSSSARARNVEINYQGAYYVVGMVTNVAGGTSAGNLVTALINCVNPPMGQ